jgi:hypothetical protein
MKLRVRLVLLVAAPVMFLMSCSRPTAPVETGGNIVLRFEPASSASAASAPAGTAALDSVVVRVFRAGGGITQEVVKGAPVGVDPVEVSVSCVAENGKRVSVELFENGTMTYHGVATGVDVAANRATDVTVDAYPFDVASVNASPSVVDEGTSFTVEWPSVAIASDYVAQASHSADFATVEWQQVVTDTVAAALLPPGSHYFRVAPRTPYAQGTFAGPGFGYVRGGSGAVRITGFSARGVIPNETVSILGENLDFPGTQAVIGTMSMNIVSSAWDELVVEMPRDATTDRVTVGSLLGSHMSAEPLVALRIAYVTAARQFADSFVELMTTYSKDVNESGVVVITLPALDTRDMTVFDIIVVANDTGTDASNWGGGVTSRALTILSSGANVLAMGDGGLAFLKLVLPAYGVAMTVSQATSCYATSPNVPVFQDPHSVMGTVLPAWADICTSSERMLGLQNPSGLTLYGATSAAANRWMLVDQVVGGHRYLFWGFAADPKVFTTTGKEVMANVMYLLNN